MLQGHACSLHGIDGPSNTPVHTTSAPNKCILLHVAIYTVRGVIIKSTTGRLGEVPPQAGRGWRQHYSSGVVCQAVPSDQLASTAAAFQSSAWNGCLLELALAVHGQQHRWLPLHPPLLLPRPASASCSLCLLPAASCWYLPAPSCQSAAV